MRRVKGILLALTVLISGCGKPGKDPAPEAYVFPVPAHFPQPQFDTENPMTRAGIELGRQLFFDVRLSANNKISCTTCHDPSRAFSDGIALTSAGVSGTKLLRHAPALFNMAWANNGLFWDGGSTNLESQAFGPLTAHDEMGQDLFELTDELNAVPEYVNSFQNAFGGPVTSQNVVKALAQFQRSLISATSRYDKYKLGKPGGTLTSEELAGMELVKNHCQACHAGELFTDFGYHNNGLDKSFKNTDFEGIYLGRYRISYDEKDLGKFKTPSLRNVALTAPYMHDGRLADLEEVLDHYATGIKSSPTLDEKLPATGLHFSPTEKARIIAFLKTLSDEEFMR